MGRDKSLLFGRDELLKRGEYELTHDKLYMEDPPGWFTKFFFGADNTSYNAYNIARVVAEAVVMRFERKLLEWVDQRIEAKLDEHCGGMHHGCVKSDE